MTRYLFGTLAGPFVVCCAVLLLGSRETPAQGGRVAMVLPASLSELRAWDARLDRMLRDGDLRVASERDDTVLPGRRHQRLQQVHLNVPLVGGGATRQLRDGQTVSLLASLYQDIDVSPEPQLTAAQAKAAIERLAGADLGLDRVPALVVLPLDEGGYALAYWERVATADDLVAYFVDAHTGRLLLRYSDLKTQAAVGSAVGVLSDSKKISVSLASGVYTADDQLRPPVLRTYDLRGNVTRTLDFLSGRTGLTVSDRASDTDNHWTDGAAVDAHVYAGWTYDYLFKQFGRQGADDQNHRIVSLVHPVRREDLLRHPSSIVSLFYLNAAYFGDGLMMFGEGLPAGYVRASDRKRVNYWSTAIDIVAHELAHGLTQYSSNLIYRNESGALNEAFSDIIGTGVEFFFQSRGDGLLKADWLHGEDAVTPGGNRSLENPRAYGHPDHYSLRRFIGTAIDNGGVHTNSSIVNHAFYLAIEGGRNRTSGLSVEGVGFANHAQIEKVFYRAFAYILTATADFAMARAATIQSARDLHGAASAVERAVTQAWTAVGVG